MSTGKIRLPVKPKKAGSGGTNAGTELQAPHAGDGGVAGAVPVPTEQPGGSGKGPAIPGHGAGDISSSAAAPLAPAGTGPGTYAVGYGKPPVHGRFKKGQSGNPYGKRPGTQDLAAIVQRELDRKVPVQEAGRKRLMSVLQVAVRSLTNKAAKGDLRALAEAIRYAEGPARKGHTHAKQPDAEEDADIIRRFLERLKQGDKA